MILWILSNSWPRQHLCPMARRRSFFELSGCRKFRTFCSACCRNTHKNMSSCWQDAYSTAVLPYNHKDRKAWQGTMPCDPKVIMEQLCAPLACGVYKQPPFPSATDTLAKTHTIAAIIKRLFFIVASYRERNSKPA